VKLHLRKFHNFLQLFLGAGFHELGLLASFAAYNFALLFCLRFRSVHVLSHFLLYMLSSDCD
jgi:uncharacterized membrane protein